MSFSFSARAAKPLRAVAFALPFVVLAVAAHAQHDEHAQNGSPSQPRAQSGSPWQSGKDVYDKVCGYCHAPEAGVGTVLAGRELPEIYLIGILRSGLNAMPAFPASFIDDESIGMVAEYIATLPAPGAEPASDQPAAAP